MTAEIDWAALAVFVFLFGLVTAFGFGAARIGGVPRPSPISTNGVLAAASSAPGSPGS